MSKIDIHKLLTELSIIGRITPGYKINTRGDVIILDTSTWYQGLMRTYRGDNRFQTMDRIKNIVRRSRILNESLVEGENYMGLNYSEFLTIFVTALRRAQSGLERLSSTYSEDPLMSEYIKINMTIVNSIINKLSVSNLST